MSDRLQELTDRLDIAEVLARYCEALDDRRWELLETVFTADATCDYGSVGTPAGLADITDTIRGTIGDLDATQHLIGNVQVAVSGDTATARCYLTSQHVRHGAPGGQTYAIGGSYHDTLVRTPDGWRISSRRLQRMWADGNRDVVRRRGPA